MNRRRLLRAGTLALASSIAGCTFGGAESGPETTESVSDRYAVDAGTRVDVLNRHGSITVTPVPGEQVVVDATKRTRQGRDALERIRIEGDRSGEVLIVQAAYPDVELLEQPRVAVDFSVGLPEHAVAGAFETADGRRHRRGRHRRRQAREHERQRRGEGRRRIRVAGDEQRSCHGDRYERCR